MDKEYKILTKSQSDRMWKDIFSQYDERAIDILNGAENASIKRQLISLQHMFQMFNADFNSVLQEIKTFVDNDDLAGLELRAREIKKSLNKYKDVLNEQVAQGTELRKTEGTKYPDIFGEQDRVFINVPKMNTAIKDSQGLFENIRYAFVGEHFDFYLSDAETSYVVEYSKQTEKSHSFLSRRLELLNYANDIKKANMGDLFNLLHMEYSDVKRIMWERQRSGDTTNAELRKVLYDKVIFNHAKSLLKQKLEDSPHVGEQDAIKYVLWFMRKSYQNALDSMEKSTAKKSDNSLSVDTLIFSKDPMDIATMSTYVDWENNCMLAGKENFLTYIRYSVGLGTVVVNAIDSKNPFKKVSQIILDPYTNAKDGTTMYVARNVYGTSLPELKPLVEKIVREQINPKEFKNNSIYKLDMRLYPDSGTDNVMFANDFWGALDLLQIPYSKKSEILNFQGRRLDLSGAGEWLTELPANIHNARIELNGANLLKELPRGLQTGYFRLVNNNSIKELPSDFKTNGISLENTKITRLPDNFSVNNLQLRNQKNIKDISNINIKQIKWLDLMNTGVSQLPEGMVLESLAVVQSLDMKSLPKKIKIINHLNICDSAISELPSGLNLAAYLDISGSAVRKIPNNTKAEVLRISPIDQISSLPPGIKSVKCKGEDVDPEKIKEWRANYRRERKEELEKARSKALVKSVKSKNNIKPDQHIK
jgi:hypothetical protein